MGRLVLASSSLPRTIPNNTRVLVVDDDHHARFLLGALLDRAGYTVVPACDGRTALTELQKRHFDAVVTDYRMAFLNGIELLRQSCGFYVLAQSKNESMAPG